MPDYRTEVYLLQCTFCFPAEEQRTQISYFFSPLPLQEFIPYMAEKYNFQYELVQYKWPRWLHQQTEKQRIIWGYKILFLDVLFPLAVDKILFVDADQVTQRLELLDLFPFSFSFFLFSKNSMFLNTISVLLEKLQV